MLCACTQKSVDSYQKKFTQTNPKVHVFLKDESQNDLVLEMLIPLQSHRMGCVLDILFKKGIRNLHLNFIDNKLLSVQDDSHRDVINKEKSVALRSIANNVTKVLRQMGHCNMTSCTIGQKSNLPYQYKLTITQNVSPFFLNKNFQ